MGTQQNFQYFIFKMRFRHNKRTQRRQLYVHVCGEFQTRTYRTRIRAFTRTTRFIPLRIRYEIFTRGILGSDASGMFQTSVYAHLYEI